MAVDAYADSQATDDTGDGLGWATAKLTQLAADVVAGPGGRVFSQDSVGGGFTETQASSKTYADSGTIDNPVQWIACKSGTTNEPPVTADLVLDRDDGDLALLQVTGAGNDLSNSGYVDLWGFKLEAADDIISSGFWKAHHSILVCDRIVEGGVIQLMDGCELAFQAGGEVAAKSGHFKMLGGEITGVTDFWGISFGLPLTLDSVDLGSLGAAVGFALNNNSTELEVLNCKIPVSYVLVEGIFGKTSFTKMVGCTSSADHTATIRQYRYENRWGFVLDDTPFISGGAQDRASGDGYCFSMTVRDNVPTERISPLYTEWFEIWLPAGSTSIEFEIMRKDTGTPADLFNDLFWTEAQIPSSAVGAATAQYVSLSSRVADPVATAAALTSSAVIWSNLGGDTAKKQKIVLSFSATEFDGMARFRHAYAERGTGILLVYFEPLPLVA